MSVCTLISAVPRLIRESTPGLVVDFYYLNPAKNGIEVLKVDDSFYYKPGLDGNSDKINTPAKEICDSVVNGYNSSQVGFGDDACPAFFYVEGEFTKESASIKFKKEIEEAIRKQNNWFTNLVRIADDDWAATHRHAAISDLQRHACKELGQEREWAFVPENDSKESKCPACGSKLLIPDAVVCAVCRSVLNPKKYAEMKFATA